MPLHLFQRKDDLINEFICLLDKQHPRDDYQELLELAIVILGGQPKRGVCINRPGALHRARWMAKIIYAFKLYLFRDPTQFRLTATEESGIKKFIEFSISTYLVP